MFKSLSLYHNENSLINIAFNSSNQLNIAKRCWSDLDGESEHVGVISMEKMNTLNFSSQIVVWRGFLVPQTRGYHIPI
jgi:hypothetical protein